MVSQKDFTPTAPRFQHIRLSVQGDGVCHLQLNRPPVNALNTAFWSELLLALDHLENDLYPQTVRVLVISSNARGPIFSAGNDLSELHVPSTTNAKFTKFWVVSATFLARLYKSPLYTIAAIRGATPAGGCIMSLCCDYRIALQKTTMGLNEVTIGLAVPRFWAKLLVATIRDRARGEEMLASGEMISADEAKSLGLVNRVLQDDDRVALNKEALATAKQWALQKNVIGRVETKLFLRQEFANHWTDYAPDEARSAWEQLSQPSTIAMLGAVMKRLSRKTNAKL